MTERVLLLWGKTTDDDRFHPAIYHMIDVAQVARALLTARASRRLSDTLRSTWAGADGDALERWLPFMIALHDIGKLSAPFQGQQSTPQAKRQRERLIQEKFELGTDGDRPPTHSAISARWLSQKIKQLEPGITRNTSFAIRDAAGGHHGWFAKELTAVGEYLARHEPPIWNDLRLDGYHLLRSVLGPASGSLGDIGQPRRVRPATAAFTGLTVIADWVASNTYYFRPDQTTPLDDYVERSLGAARDALYEIGLTVDRPAPLYEGFGKLFPDHRDTRDLQVQIDALSNDELPVPGLFVIEAPAGEGKTEAALALERRLTSQGASDELYFGLPTMATSNQMFKRLTGFCDHVFGAQVAVKLAHGQATLVEGDLRTLARLQGSYGDADPSQRTSADWTPSNERVLQWFGSSKRALLAPFGVGTVDQIELAGLNVRHAMLRLFGLAGKVVIIDEVHAYDTYMSTILEHTLCWLGSLGSSVILLSATLPVARHQALAQSYLAGLQGLQQEQVHVAPVTDYPSLTIYGAQHTAQKVPAASRTQVLALRFVHDATIPLQAKRLLDLTVDGGAVARICNRVDDAQAIYTELRRQNIPNLTLIHARYPLEERQEREAQVEQLVGKQSQRLPDDRLIIIGTQVLEQSLDYDVDVMVTDLAPLDLLLQRAGRLHRHTRSRVSSHSTPTLYVQCICGNDGLPAIDRWKRIYAPFILWQTWLTLCVRSKDGVVPISLPADYRPLIEAVYGDSLPMLPSDHPHAKALDEARSRHLMDESNQRQQADQRLTQDPLLPDALAGGGDLQFIEDDEGTLSGWQVAKTRLGERLTVIPVYNHTGRWTFDAAGEHSVGTVAKDDIATQNRLLRRSLPVSDPRLIAALHKGAWSFREVPPLLKYTPPLVLDPSGHATVPGMIVRLDADLGLVIEKEEVA